jgi:hypothetical protein
MSYTVGKNRHKAAQKRINNLIAPWYVLSIQIDAQNLMTKFRTSLYLGQKKPNKNEGEIVIIIRLFFFIDQKTEN